MERYRNFTEYKDLGINNSMNKSFSLSEKRGYRERATGPFEILGCLLILFYKRAETHWHPLGGLLLQILLYSDINNDYLPFYVIKILRKS